MNKIIIYIIFLMLFASSCFVQSPKYGTVENVMLLQLGMTRAQVEETLGIKPYDLKMVNDTSNVFIYVYRVTDRKTISFNTSELNGTKSTGKYVQLDVTYSKSGKVIKIETCRYCPDNLVKWSKVDFEKVMVFITVTLPVLLIYFGLK